MQSSGAKLKTFLKRLFVASGGASGVRVSRRSSFRILMYHRFTGDSGTVQSQLREQIRHLRKHYRPISLGAACESLRRSERIQDGSVAVTVDDGYGDFSTAWPVFREEGIPVTLYAVSGFLNRNLWLWPDILDHSLRTTKLKMLDAVLPDNSVFRGAPQTAFQFIAQALIRSPDAERRSFLQRLPDLTGVQIPAEIPKAYAPLTWAELKRMAEEGLDVGAHTRTHPILSRLGSAQQKQEEIAGSRRDIEKEIGTVVQNFCYPNGTEGDFDAECVQAVEAAGFASAVTAIRGLNPPGADRLRLRRIGIDPGLPAAAFALETAGFRMN